MKIKTIRSFSIICLLATFTTLSYAQKNEVLKNIRIKNTLKTDGELSEWGDSLSVQNATTKLSYSVGNDNENLYVAIKTSDPIAIRKILTYGLSFMLNKEGKKKSGPAITFPVIDISAVRATLQKNSQAQKKPSDLEVTKQLLTKVTGVRADGFKEILDGNISINNEYGIKAASSIDEKNTFRYELTIPLKHLNLTAEYKEPLFYNFRVNGAQRTVIEQGPSSIGAGRYGGYGYGYGGYGRGNRETYRRTISETVETWARFTLAQP